MHADANNTASALPGESLHTPDAIKVTSQSPALSSVPPQPEVSDALRRHGGNVPTLPQTKQCPHCSARFTRTTHLNRHLKTHSTERPHKCEVCAADFTRSDLLSRHKKSCTGVSRSRRNQIHSVAPAVSTVWHEDDASSMYSSSVTESSITDDASSLLSFHTAESAQSTLNTVSMNGSSSNVFDGLFTGIFSPPLADSGAGMIWAGLSTPAPHVSSGPSGPTIANDSGSAVMVTEESGPTNGASLNTTASSASFADLLLSFGEFDNTTPKMHTQGLPDLDVVAGSSTGMISVSANEPTTAELDHYMSQFFGHFSSQMSLIHEPTWTAKGKPEILLKAMRAAGALYTRTPRAASFILQTLNSVRDTLLADLAKLPVRPTACTYTIAAIVILQYIGLFHQDPEVRASHHIFHGILVQLIRTRRLITESASWEPPELTDLSTLDRDWHTWVEYETLKRALLLSWVLDCCHVVYFGLPGSFATAEFTLNLVSEAALWDATSANEWLHVLLRPSQFRTPDWRMRGFPFQKSLHAMANAAKLEAINEHCLINADAHWAVAHTILRNLYSLCPPADPNAAWIAIKRGLRSSLVPAHRKKMAAQLSDIPDGVDGTQVLQLQYILQNWLNSYFRAPEMQDAPSVNAPYTTDALPCYWLAQVSLMALQEGMPPFVPDEPLDTDTHFKLIKSWVRRIQSFLRAGTRQPTLLWNDMMKIRLQAAAGGEANDGLLDPFPSGTAGFWQIPPPPTAPTTAS